MCGSIESTKHIYGGGLDSEVKPTSFENLKGRSKPTITIFIPDL